MSCDSIRIHVNKYISIPYGLNRNGISSIRIVTQSRLIQTLPIKYVSLVYTIFHKPDLTYICTSSSFWERLPLCIKSANFSEIPRFTYWVKIYQNNCVIEVSMCWHLKYGSLLVRIITNFFNETGSLFPHHQPVILSWRWCLRKTGKVVIVEKSLVNISLFLNQDTNNCSTKLRGLKTLIYHIKISVTYIPFASEDIRNDCLTKTCTHADWTNEQTTNKQKRFHLPVFFTIVWLFQYQIDTAGTGKNWLLNCYCLRFYHQISRKFNRCMRQKDMPSFSYSWLNNLDKTKQMLHLSKTATLALVYRQSTWSIPIFFVPDSFGIFLFNKSPEESCKCFRPRLHGTGSARSRYQIEYFQDECGS